MSDRFADENEQRVIGQIKAARQRLGLTVRAAGERIGMDRSYWSYIENGRSTRVGTANRMAEAVGLRLDMVEANKVLTDRERETVANLLCAYVRGQRANGRKVPAEITVALAKMRPTEEES